MWHRMGAPCPSTGTAPGCSGMPAQPDGEVAPKSPRALRFLRSLSHCLSQLHRRINEEKESKFAFLLLAQLKCGLSGKRAAKSALETNRFLMGHLTLCLGSPFLAWRQNHQCDNLWKRFQELQKGKDVMVSPQLAPEHNPAGNVAVPGHPVLFQKHRPASQEGMSFFM